jgi:hypothetical protein
VLIDRAMMHGDGIESHQFNVDNCHLVLLAAVLIADKLSSDYSISNRRLSKAFGVEISFEHYY